MLRTKADRVGGVHGRPRRLCPNRSWQGYRPFPRWQTEAGPRDGALVVSFPSPGFRSRASGAIPASPMKPAQWTLWTTGVRRGVFRLLRQRWRSGLVVHRPRNDRRRLSSGIAHNRVVEMGVDRGGVTIAVAGRFLLGDPNRRRDSFSAREHAGEDRCASVPRYPAQDGQARSQNSSPKATPTTGPQRADG